jgi:hypothetical protein
VGLLDIFSAKNGQKAAAFAAQTEGQYGQQANNELTAGQQGALGNLIGGPLSAAGQVEEKGYTALDQLSQQYGQAQNYLGQAGQQFQGEVNAGNVATNQYMNLLGLGAQGGAGAQAALASTPGYQFQQQQGQDALNRTAAARGMLSSGNNSADLLKYSQGLASSTYQNAIANLQPGMSMYQTGVSGQANALGAQGQLAAQLGNQNASTLNTMGSGAANAYTNAANTYMQTGVAKAANDMSVGQGVAQAGASGIMANQKASENMFGALTGAASGLMKLFA